MFFQNLIDWIYRVFRRKPKTSNSEQADNAAYVERYEDIIEVNVTAMVAQRLANLIVADSTIEIADKNARAEFINDALGRCIAQLRTIVTRILGIGGVVLKPYLHAGRIYTDIVPQRDFFVIEQIGEVVTSACFLAETFTRDNRTYSRLEYHSLEPSGIYTIEQRAMIDNQEYPPSSVPEWEHIKPSQSISGVKQMLFAFIQCPTDNRRSASSVYGVPVTYGQDKLIKEITTLLNEMQREFVDKRVFVGISDLLFDGQGKLPVDGKYKKFKTDDENFWEVFSPDIRVEAYVKGIDYRLELLEKAIGVNKGVLTNMETADATATAIRRSTFDTWTFVDHVHDLLEIAINNLVYAYDVIANANNLVGRGEYRVTFDWDYSLLEDSDERFNQLQTGVASGYINGWEARAWVMNENAEDAQANMPEMEQLLSEA